MKTAFALVVVSVLALVACAQTQTQTQSTSAAARSSAAPAATSGSAAPRAAGSVVVGPAVSSGPARPGAIVSGAPGASAPPAGDPDADAGAVATSGAVETPSEQKTGEPASTPTEIPYVAPDAPPQILAFSISSNTVHPGDVLSGSVTASSNVASVEVRVAGYSYNMSKTAPGEFSLAVTVPSVPRMFRRTYPLVAIARNTRGDATQRTTQITIR